MSYRFRGFSGFEQDALGTVHLVRCPEGGAQFALEFIRVREELHCTGQQVHSGRRIGPLPRADAGASEPFAAFLRESSCGLLRARELFQIKGGLLEVVADQLLGAVASVEPSPGELVQLPAFGFRDAAIRHVADEDVVEAEAVVQRIHESSFGEAGKVTFGAGLWCKIVELRG